LKNVTAKYYVSQCSELEFYDNNKAIGEFSQQRHPFGRQAERRKETGSQWRSGLTVESDRFMIHV
jgi:hypothetical protein